MFVLDGTPARFDTARTIRVRIMAADTMERIMTHYVEIDLEPIGCMDPAAARVSCLGGDGRDLTACTNARTTASNVTDETAGTFANPQGNFDVRIRVPLGACRYPPTVASRGEPVNVAAPSFKRPEEVTNPDEVRGSFKLAVPTGATGTQAALEASEPDDTILNMVSVASSSSSSSLSERTIVDTSLVINLGPCGYKFDKPVTVSLYVGTISDDEFPLLLHATKKDCNNFAAGLGEWESVRNLQYDPASGLLSGEIDHFSVVAAARRPVPVASFSTQKPIRMGGGCPNECSGHGHCRAESKCVCFTGFAGFDCSVRQCPYGDAWGIDAPVTRQ